MRASALAAVVVLVVLAQAAGAYTQGDPEFRGFWIDSWDYSMLSQSGRDGGVDALLGKVGTPETGAIRDANANAIIVQVRRNADVCYPSGVGEPYFGSLVPADYNALKAVIDAAHDTTGGKRRIEVHAWIVVFRTNGGKVYAAHHGAPTADIVYPDNYWTTRTDTGAEVSSDFPLDPGHPKVLEYLTNVCMDLVNNFEIDGIHYDYVRFTARNQGYNPTSVARYNARYGLTGQPDAADEQWKQWRRDQITAFVRQVYAKIQSSKPWVKQSGSFVTWNPSPVDSTREAFMGTRPYYDVFSDWDAWMQEGIVDMAVPMTYYDWASLPGDFVRWSNFQKDRKFNRHMVIGPGIYMNSLENSIRELNMTRDPSPSGNYANGFSGYSHRVPYAGGNEQFPSFIPTFVSQVANSPVAIPAMPWKTAPTKGHISGRVTHAPGGTWADGALVTLTGPENRTQYCDGTGFFAFIDVTPGTYTVSVSKDHSVSQERQVTVSLSEVVGNMYVVDFALITAPFIRNVRPLAMGNDTATLGWDTDQASSSLVEYGVTTDYGSSTTLDPAEVTAHSVSLSGLLPDTVYHYRVTSANSSGSRTSDDYTFRTGTFSLTVVADPAEGGSTTGSAWYIPGSQVTVTAAANSGYFFDSWSTNADGTGLLSKLASYTFTMPSSNTTLYANFLNGVADIIIESRTGGLNYGWYSDAGGFGNSTAKSLASGCTPGIGSRYIILTNSYEGMESHFAPAISVDGSYQVWATWGNSTSGGTSIKHSVAHRDGVYVKTFNQNRASNLYDKWNSIGTFPFASGASGQCGEVKQYATATEYNRRIMPDAMKWVYVGPFKAANPHPRNGGGARVADLTLSWSPGGTTGSYDVYFGTASDAMTLVSADQSGTTFTPESVALGVTYYWRVDSKFLGKTTTGDTWSFTTMDVPPPVAPTYPNPAAGSARHDPAGQTLSWMGGGSDVAYDVYFGTTPTMTLISNHQTVTNCATGPLSPSTPYYWKVVAFNAVDEAAAGPVWSFSTAGEVTTIGDARKLADGTGVVVGGCITAKFTSGGVPSAFYIEDPNKTCGLRVAWPGAVAVGDTVELAGLMGTTADGERCLTAASAIVVNPGPGAITFRPPFVSARSLGGSAWSYDAVTGAGQCAVSAWRWVKLEDPKVWVRQLDIIQGLNNIGLIVQTAGKVAAVGADYFYLDDGSRYDEYQTPDAASGMAPGFRVALPEGATAPELGSSVLVTGISSCYKPGDQVWRILRVWRPEDIVAAP